MRTHKLARKDSGLSRGLEQPCSLAKKKDQERSGAEITEKKRRNRRKAVVAERPMTGGGARATPKKRLARETLEGEKYKKQKKLDRFTYC